MEMSIDHVQGKVPVTILGLQGELDASNYQELIARAKELHAAGSRNFLVDLSGVRFMSSSGLVALHSIALLLRGEPPLDLEAGWSALHTMEKEQDSGLQKHIKLLNPQPKVLLTLQKTGMDLFLQVFTNREEAIASFG